MEFAAKPIQPGTESPCLDPGAETAYLGLGGNIGDSWATIDDALLLLAGNPSIDVVNVSSLYRTAPIGRTDQPDFLNAVVQIRTKLSPDDLLSTTLHIENQLGRIRTQKWAPRVIDIDVLLYGDRMLSTPSLTVPHPRMPERAFVLVPLAEIAPGLRIPGSTIDETVDTLAATLAAETRIVKVDPPPRSFVQNRATSPAGTPYKE